VFFRKRNRLPSTDYQNKLGATGLQVRICAAISILTTEITEMIDEKKSITRKTVSREDDTPQAYAEFAKDSRQRKLLRKVISGTYIQDASFLKDVPPRKLLDVMWEALDPEARRDAYRDFKERDAVEAPPYRNIGLRLRQIRTDRKLTLSEFAKMLSSPAGELPHPGQAFEFSQEQIRDWEYGRRPFAGTALPVLIYHKFGISAEWLTEGRGTPHTRTETLTLDRMVSLEERMTYSENRIDANIGVPQLRLLEEQNHERVIKEENGFYRIIHGTNTQLRLDLDEANQKIKQLEKTLNENQKLWEVASALIQNYESTLSRVDAELNTIRSKGKEGGGSELNFVAEKMEAVAKMLETTSNRLDRMLEAFERSGSDMETTSNRLDRMLEAVEGSGSDKVEKNS